MKKYFFDLKASGQIQLVKGCPADIQDYNGDGEINQDDQDYYDGYMDGYDQSDDDGEEHSEAYYLGQHDGSNDYNDDIISGHDSPGADIQSDNFSAPSAYY